ncbi:MAG: GNAT family N-acetyltransferase [Vallitalea sp.]|nr:GNAT family N-acetyltransferase [Vallitalea sp.]
MIRKATINDINSIMKVKIEAVNVMKQDNNDQWDDEYPSKEMFINDINSNELYVYEIENEIAGVMCITTKEDDEYKPVNWSVTGKHFIVHRLAIADKFRKNGIAMKLLSYAETLGKENDILIIKLDTFSKNKRAQNLFVKMGYNYVSDIHFPRKKEPYHCYEKIIN